MGLIDRHVPCIGCEYDLYGIADDGTCPECGLAKGPSLDVRRLLFQPARILRFIWYGLVLWLAVEIAPAIYLPLAIWLPGRWLYVVGGGVSAVSIIALIIVALGYMSLPQSLLGRIGAAPVIVCGAYMYVLSCWSYLQSYGEADEAGMVPVIPTSGHAMISGVCGIIAYTGPYLLVASVMRRVPHRWGFRLAVGAGVLWGILRLDETFFGDRPNPLGLPSLGVAYALSLASITVACVQVHRTRKRAS